MGLTFKMTCRTSIFSQVLLTERVIRSYFEVDKFAFNLEVVLKLLIQKLFTIAKLINEWQLLLTCSNTINSFKCFSTNFRLLASLNDKLFSRELKILNDHGLWKNKKCRDKIQIFDWIKFVRWHRLVNIDWLAKSIDLAIWLANYTP